MGNNMTDNMKLFFGTSHLFKEMLGRKIESVVLSADKETITFKFQDGFEKAFGVEGDCCSSSWIEHLELPKQLRGATLTHVVDSLGVETPSEDHECLQVYTTSFATDRGEIILEYRNSSNGYYGGYLVPK